MNKKEMEMGWNGLSAEITSGMIEWRQHRRRRFEKSKRKWMKVWQDCGRVCCWMQRQPGASRLGRDGEVSAM
jgi:hypothetical protein